MEKIIIKALAAAYAQGLVDALADDGDLDKVQGMAEKLFADLTLFVREKSVKQN